MAKKQHATISKPYYALEISRNANNPRYTVKIRDWPGSVLEIEDLTDEPYDEWDSLAHYVVGCVNMIDWIADYVKVGNPNASIRDDPDIDCIADQIAQLRNRVSAQLRKMKEKTAR